MMDKANLHHGSVYLANLSDIRNQSLQSDRKEADDNEDQRLQWINIEEKSVMSLIIEAFVDPQKKKVLNLTSDRALAASEILGICKMPTTSGYRTINSLIKSGLLVKSSNGSIKNGRRISNYRSIFENVKINIEKNKVSVLAKFAKA